MRKRCLNSSVSGYVLGGLAFVMLSLSASALASGAPVTDDDCLDSPEPVYSNVRFDVIDALLTGTTIKVNAILTQPVKWRKGCFRLVEEPSAVVILHGSGGIDNRGIFYAQALKRQYVTLSVEMFQGSIAGGESGRPPLPIFNYTHAFGALNYLVAAEGFIDENGDIVPEDVNQAGLARKVPVDSEAVGCLGFSWGGVICNQIATELYSQENGDALYGTNLRYAALVANYPACWGRNEGARNKGLIGLDFGSPAAPLTGSPLLIQVGAEDAYDNLEGQSGSEACNQLKAGLIPEEQEFVDVIVLANGTHAFDRVFAPPAVIVDPFARLGQFLNEDPTDDPAVPVIPDLRIANQALRNVKQFFREHLH